ncbi:hypothetical protein [Flavobacterium gelatinilyticum]|uniref:hypothetical protein n=1 Tax=Flavobacterium gelatinilyticum TaxID=3003260 RepID=UPI002480B454|nr:hypothetical protein [Flavobacterium gelatinilyticum]
MNSSAADFTISSSAEQFNIQSNSNFKDAEFYSEKYHMADLYSKHEDEPDLIASFYIGTMATLMKKII